MPVNGEVDPDAERRTVYITNANSWSILAIVATASTNQAITLRGFIYKYLNFHALISVSIPVSIIITSPLTETDLA